MKKIIRSIFALFGFLMFFVFIDDSCVGLREHFDNIKKWINK